MKMDMINVVRGLWIMVMVKSIVVVIIVVIIVMWSRFFLWMILLKCLIIKLFDIIVKLLMLKRILNICGDIL